MRKLFSILPLLVLTACNTDYNEPYVYVEDTRDHTYELQYQSTFTNSEMYVYNETTKDTILKSKEKGVFTVDLKYKNYYTFQIRQLGPLERDEHHTYIKLTDVTSNKVIDVLDTAGCYVGWGYSLLVH